MRGRNCWRHRTWRCSAASGWCFATCRWPCQPAARWCSPGRTGRANPRCCGCWPASCGRRRVGCCGTALTPLADLAEHGRRVAYLGHQDAVKPGLTVTENLRFAARVSGAQIAAALEAVGLEALADLPARMLSAGPEAAAGAGAAGAVDRAAVAAGRADAGAGYRLGRAVRRAAGARIATRAALVVAATHLPLPLPDAAELRLA